MFKFIFGFLAGLVFALSTAILAMVGAWVGFETKPRETLPRTTRMNYDPSKS